MSSSVGVGKGGEGGGLSVSTIVSVMNLQCSVLCVKLIMCVGVAVERAGEWSVLVVLRCLVREIRLTGIQVSHQSAVGEAEEWGG